MTRSSRQTQSRHIQKRHPFCESINTELYVVCLRMRFISFVNNFFTFVLSKKSFFFSQFWETSRLLYNIAKNKENRFLYIFLRFQFGTHLRRSLFTVLPLKSNNHRTLPRTLCVLYPDKQNALTAPPEKKKQEIVLNEIVGLLQSSSTVNGEDTYCLGGW